MRVRAIAPGNPAIVHDACVVAGAKLDADFLILELFKTS
jgi:hypothetical protein